ncbi:MAG: BtpA/SgcQ family protein [Actinomycetota bacterium]|nr:BtpA/SgcQ family protein [Actinomycetota bacterium]
MAPPSHGFHAVFPGRKPLIGTIHLEPLPGAPKYTGASLAGITVRAVEDAKRYVAGGIDGLIVENEGDIPFLKPEQIGPETVAALTVATAAVVDAVDVPVGVFCLANATIPSLAVAKATGARFIRANQWANAYIANEGFIEGSAAVALRYRAAIHAGEVAVLADVHVKHGSHAIVADRSIAELTHDTEAFGADALIATGQRTGDPTTVEDVAQMSKVANRPVLVGSGLNTSNARDLMTVADGAVVGSAMKEGGVWWNPVSVERTRSIVAEVDKVR